MRYLHMFLALAAFWLIPVQTAADTCTVTKNTDNNFTNPEAGTIRFCVNNAQDGDLIVIDFDPGYGTGLIELDQGALTINQDVTLDGTLSSDPSAKLTLTRPSGTEYPLVIINNTEGNVTLRDLIFWNHSEDETDFMDAVLAYTPLVVNRTEFVNLPPFQYGRAIYAQSDLTVIDSIFDNNHFMAYEGLPGGAIHFHPGSDRSYALKIYRSAFVDNEASGIASTIYASTSPGNGDRIEIYDSNFTSNGTETVTEQTSLLIEDADTVIMDNNRFEGESSDAFVLLLSDDGTAALTNNTSRLNNRSGGHIDGGSCTISDSLFHGNAQIGLNVNSACSISNTSFTSNGGDGLRLYDDANLSLVTVDGSGDHGLNISGTANAQMVTITDSSFTNNAYLGITSSSPGLILNRSTVAQNQGGGVYLSPDETDVVDIHVVNSTITNNTLAHYDELPYLCAGIGVGNSNLGNDDAIHIDFSTVTQNHSPDHFSAAGILSGSHRVFLSNTIVAENLYSVDTPADIGGPVQSLWTPVSVGPLTIYYGGHNLIGTYNGDGGTYYFEDGLHGDIVGTPSVLIDPKLDALADNGGPTQTRAILAGSPAINAGGSHTYTTFATDQRGQERKQNDYYDIGAFESDRNQTQASSNLVPVIMYLLD